MKEILNATLNPEIKTVTMESFITMQSLSMVSPVMHAMDDAKKTPLKKPHLVSVTTATEEPFYVVTSRGRATILVIPRYPNARIRELLFSYVGVRLEREKTVRLTDPITGQTLYYSPIISPAHAIRLVKPETAIIPIIASH